MSLKFTNNATATLLTAITAGGTSLNVASGAGSLFPAISSPDTFYCTLYNSTASNYEVVLVTARVGDLFTIVRGQDGTTALNWSAGDSIDLRANAAVLCTFPQTTGSTGSLVMPAGTTAQRDSAPVGGYTRWNLTALMQEIFNGTTWLMSLFATGPTGSAVIPAGTTAQRDVSPTSYAIRGNSTLGLPEWYNTATASWISYGGEQAAEVTIPSAGTTAIGAASSTNVLISGTTAITAFDTAQAGIVRRVRFSGVLTLTYNATTLLLPGGANITTAANDCADFESLGSGNWICRSYATASGTALVSSVAAQIQQPTVTNPSNTLVISFPQLNLAFRNTILTTGTTTTIVGTPASLTIAATDSFGLVTAAGNQRIAILAINNAGTIELAASSLAGGVSLDETGVITTATTATTATAIKAANVRTGVAYRVVGFVDSTFTTAVGWGTPALVQGCGGQALAAMSSLGYGQTWQNVIGSRTAGTTYYNTTGKPILVQVNTTLAANGQLDPTVGGVAIAGSNVSVTGGAKAYVCFVVPSGMSYVVALSIGTIERWSELR